MTEYGAAGAHPPVGSVAEEAARLVDAFAGWAADAGLGRGTTHGPHGDEGQGAWATPGADDPGERPGDGAGSSGARCAACGAEAGVGGAASCRVCPVCQGITLLRSVRPETVERLADLASALAATLRDLAASRRTADGHPARPGGGTTVQDIPVDDGDVDHQDDHQHHHQDGRERDHDDVGSGGKEPVQ